MAKDFLGKGVSFPLQIKGGKLAWAEYEDSIRQSILIILQTSPGERVMRPEFGCGLQDLVFAPNNVDTATRAIEYVREALERWEPRIEVLAVDAGPAQGEAHRLDIRIEYRVISHNNRYNLVYPFYLEKG